MGRCKHDWSEYTLCEITGDGCEHAVEIEKCWQGHAAGKCSHKETIRVCKKCKKVEDAKE